MTDTMTAWILSALAYLCTRPRRLMAPAIMVLPDQYSATCWW
jgi:hypothetical protein